MHDVLDVGTGMQLALNLDIRSRQGLWAPMGAGRGRGVGGDATCNCPFPTGPPRPGGWSSDVSARLPGVTVGGLAVEQVREVTFGEAVNSPLSLVVPSAP